MDGMDLMDGMDDAPFMHRHEVHPCRAMREGPAPPQPWPEHRRSASHARRVPYTRPVTVPARRSIRRLTSACLAAFAVAASAPLAPTAAAATAAGPTGSIAAGALLAAAAQAAPPAEATAAATTGSVAADAIAPAAKTSSGIPIGLAILVIGGSVLAALFVYLVGRAIRGSSGSTPSTTSGMRPASRRDASTDAWHEAGRRHPVPPREGAGDEDGPNERFG